MTLNDTMQHYTTVYNTQWRSVISGGPRFKIFEGPPPSRSAKGTS